MSRCRVSCAMIVSAVVQCSIVALEYAGHLCANDDVGGTCASGVRSNL